MGFAINWDSIPAPSKAKNKQTIPISTMSNVILRVSAVNSANGAMEINFQPKLGMSELTTSVFSYSKDVGAEECLLDVIQCFTSGIATSWSTSSRCWEDVTTPSSST